MTEQANTLNDDSALNNFSPLQGLSRIDPVQRLVDRVLRLFNLDPDIHRVARPFLSVVLYVYLLVTAIGTAGIDTRGLLSLLSVSGLTFGLAIQSMLGNTFSGLFLLLFCPFKRGWTISVDNFSGKVVSVTTRY